MRDLSKICTVVREKYGLKSFSVGVDYKNNRIDVRTSNYRAPQQFTYEGFIVNFIVENKTEIDRIEVLDLDKTSELEDISSVEEIDDEEETPLAEEINLFEDDKEDWMNEDFDMEDIDFDKI